MQSPGWEPTACVAWCLIWWFAHLDEYGHTWHWMSLLRPGVIKQYKPNLSLPPSLLLSPRPSGVMKYVNPYIPTQTLDKNQSDHMQSPGWEPTLCVVGCLIWWFAKYSNLEKDGHTWQWMCLWLGPTGLFLASPMHSRWKLTSIRRCSGGITEPSANNLLVFMLKIARHWEASRV